MRSILWRSYCELIRIR